MSTGKPTVSAIIPVYNGARQVGRAIESVLAQTYPPIEIIVVDDGSADNTLEVVAKYPVKVIAQQNSGPGAARNAGAQQSRGEWLAFLDHDDSWRPQKTEQQLRHSCDPSAGAIFTPLESTDGPITFHALWKRNVVGTPSGVMIRRKCFLEIGGFDPDRQLISTEDHNLWLRIALSNWRFARCPGHLFDYTPAENSLSTKHSRMAAAEMASFDKIGLLAGMDSRAITKRKLDVANEYVREMIGVRNSEGARELIRQSGLTNIQASLLIAAFTPHWLLEVRRRIRFRAVENKQAEFTRQLS